MTSRAFDSTVVVPTYNRAHLIPETLRSLVQQDHPFHQIIVVDDGSADDTRHAVSEFGNLVRYVRTTNRGVQYARNTGVEHAETEWVTFCDSDDILLPDYGSVFSRFVVNHPEYDLLFSRFKLFRGESWEAAGSAASGKEQSFREAREVDGFYADFQGLFPLLLQDQFLWPTGLSIRKQAFLDVGGYDPRFRRVKSEDLEFTLRAILHLRTAVSRDALARMRRHSDNDSSDGVFQSLGEATILEYILETQPAARQYEYQVKRSIARRLMTTMIGSYERGDYETCKDALGKLPIAALGIKGLLKKAIVNLPEPVRTRAWRITRRQA